MTTLPLRTLALMGAVAFLAPASQAAHHNESQPAAAAEAKADIVDVAVGAGSFKTLVAAVQAAGLEDALRGKGPLTVFAPTDEAFAKLPKGTVESLLLPENKKKLAAILTYHVVPGKVMAVDVVASSGAASLNGQRLSFKTDEKSVMVDGAKVVKADIAASNGVIHVIDTVVLPTDKDIVETAAAAGSFGTLLKAATAAGLAPTLKGKGPFTVFAPTDEAFAKLPSETLASLLLPQNKEKLAGILKAHVVEGRVFADQAAKLPSATVLSGQALPLAKSETGLSIGGANIVATDINASNGVIHVIDSVIIPE
jgi:uncharacterized surface protein with fasciclin (FAS1) repeats